MQEFSTVFDKIKLIPEVKTAVLDAKVERLVQNPEGTRVKIYVVFRRLLGHDEVLYLQREISRHYFPKNTDVRIIERFELSSQYTDAILFEEYSPSIEKEIESSVSNFAAGAFRNAVKKFDSEGTLHFELEEGTLNGDYEEKLLYALDTILLKRCGRDFKIVFDYIAPRKKNEEPEIFVSRTIEDIKENKAIEADGKENGSEPSGEGKKQKRGKSEKDVSRDDWPFVSAERSGIEGLYYGKEIKHDAIPISMLDEVRGNAVVRGQIFYFNDEKKTKSGHIIVKIMVTDFTDSVSVTFFLAQKYLESFRNTLKPGTFVKIEGNYDFNIHDSSYEIFNVKSVMLIPDFTEKRMDTAEEKRVELHCHTKMSDMDAVSDVKDIIKRCKAWGHKALAITDHGDVQAFAEAYHATEKDTDFKILYGVEGYFTDDTKEIVENSKNQRIEDTSYVVFDLETTGFNPEKNKIIEIGAVKVEGGKITGRYSAFVDPKVPIPLRIEALTSIRDDMVIGQPQIDVRLREFLEFSEGCVLVAHNAEFDMSYILANERHLGLYVNHTYIDTIALARYLMPLHKSYKLDSVAKTLKVPLLNHHRAVDDAECTALVFLKLLDLVKERGIETLDELNKKGTEDEKRGARLRSHHGIIIAKNDLGRVNLYRLISESHVNYFYRHPNIPKSLIEKYRDGLILGSACCEGELFEAIMLGRSPEEIARIVRFYDYLEIQPVGNNLFMIEDDKSPVESIEDIQEINREIVRLGEEFKKPVCATCDVHFLDPEDEIYRRIIMHGKHFDDADRQPPLYLHTTNEMLEEFSYLGADKAREVVINNPNMIADMCEKIAPVRPDKCPPVIDNSDETLRTICYNKAYSIYGDPLPDTVKKRLDRELNSIISNGYAVMYIIAQKLVWKSNEDGYLVGSRGSVGSSFAATMAGITEVNPLSPHYYCPKCHYSDFDSDEVRAYSGGAGCDMPDKKCPDCGADLMKAGFDIPFETFLGFKGNKEPDIDLNFSGEYQTKAHKYTEVIFGEGQTYRAGTVGTLADRTAYGYVKGYFGEHGIVKREAEIERIVQGCTGVHRTTGQHPGGIVVLPLGEEINTFTPVQYPANKVDSGVITTHFDYHSIDENLLKLDILGHDDPTMIRELEDLTGLDATAIPLDDPVVMSLFKSTDAIMVAPEDIGGTKTGSRGIPEFGTDNAINTLLETEPKSFADLVRISGLSHGTDVYGGNAQNLILDKVATLSECICTRDDIMTYLINKGIESEKAFKIMEAVRKGQIASGKVPKEKWQEWSLEMSEHGIPDWYIGSCEKIQYMFPKAHAAAYVMMAWRIAYCKIYYPLAYYAAFFSIRSKNFDYELMCQGLERLRFYIKQYQAIQKPTTKEADTLLEMKSVEEFYVRGFEFCPIELDKVQASRFTIVDGKLMPSITTFAGTGDAVAVAIVDAVKDGPFLSREDFKNRTHAPQKLIDLMGDLGIFGNLPLTNQISLFDNL